MGFFARLLGKSRTNPPREADCWRFAENDIVVDLSKASELTRPGGAIRLEGAGLEMGLFLMRGADGAVHAFHNSCPHGKRKLDPFRNGEAIRCCSIGKSTFGLDGTLISGSAKEAIHPRVVREENGQLTIRR